MQCVALPGARCDQGQRFAGIEQAIVERASSDGTGQHRMLREQQGAYVAEASESARGDYGNPRYARKLCRSLQIQTFEDTVSINVGVDDGGDAGILEAADEVDGAKLARLRPTLDGDLAVPGVDAHHDEIGRAHV